MSTDHYNQTIEEYALKVAVLEKEVKLTKALLESSDQTLDRLIEERDFREKQITEIARLLGIESEWSNLHDLGEESKEAASVLQASLNKAEETITKLRRLCGKAAENSRVRDKSGAPGLCIGLQQALETESKGT